MAATYLEPVVEVADKVEEPSFENQEDQEIAPQLT